jgi:transcriptional regulator with XRE-family HTH domain
MSNKKLVGDKIKGFREARKMSQEELAINSGLELSLVADIEANTNIPSLSPLI